MNTFLHDLNAQITAGNFTKAFSLLQANRHKLPSILYDQKLAELNRSRSKLKSYDILVYCHHTSSYEGNSGIQRVVRQVISGLIRKKNVRVQCVCFSADFSCLVPLSPEQNKNLSKWSGPQYSDLRIKHNNFNPSFILLPELFYSSYFKNCSQPLTALFDKLVKSAPHIVTIFYDNIPLTVPQYVGVAKEHKEYLDLILKSDVITSISEWSGCDLAEYGMNCLKYNQASLLRKIYPLMLPSMPIKSSSEDDTLPYIKSKLFNSKFILSVGSVVPHKNQLALVQAFLLYKQQSNSPIVLVLAGNCVPDYLSYLSSLESQDIIFRFKPSDSEIDYLYRNCEFVVFPSREEGYGLPILEAINYGKPVISANFGVMSEVADLVGCGVLKTDVSDIISIRNSISSLCDNKNLVGDSSFILSTANVKSWETYTDELLAIATESIHSVPDTTIYINVTFISSHDFVSGVQRVVLGIFRGLIDLGYQSNIVPVILSPSTSDFRYINDTEYHRLSSVLYGTFTCRHDGTHFKPRSESIFINAEIDVIFSESPIQVSEYIQSLASSYKLTTIAIFYDAIPYMYPQYYGEETASRHESYMKSLINYQYIFPISHESSIDLFDFFHSANVSCLSRVTPVHLAIDAFEHLELATDKVYNNIISKHHLDKNRLNLIHSVLFGSYTCLLCVSSIEPRKSQVDIARAFIENYEYFKANNIVLVFVGRNMDTGYSSMLHSVLADYPYIIHLDSASDEVLDSLYNNTMFSIFFSEKEGFGLPVVESLARGVPVFLRYSSSMRELCNSGGVFPVYQSSLSALSKELLYLSKDQNILDSLRNQLISYPVKTWKSYVSEILGFCGFLDLNQSPEFFESVCRHKLTPNMLRSQEEFTRRHCNL